MDLTGINTVVVDDARPNLMLMEAMIRKVGLNVRSFMEPLEALTFIQNNSVDLVLTDYMMPGMDGLELIREIRKIHEHVPIIMVTAAGEDRELRIEALKSGATDFLSKPLDSSECTARITNLAMLSKARNLLEDRASFLEYEVSKATGEIVHREMETLIILGKTAEYKDPETGDHISRVAHYCKLLAAGLGLSAKKQETIFHAAPLHDIGKVGIRDSILLKPARLTPEEYDIMKTHTTIGYEIIKNKKSMFLQAGALIAVSHHEKFDGKGYPNGLAGETIPVFGRITAIADVFDALTSRRPYKEPWSFEDALAELQRCKNTDFDPAMVDIFVARGDEVRAIYNQFQPEG